MWFWTSESWPPRPVSVRDGQINNGDWLLVTGYWLLVSG